MTALILDPLPQTTESHPRAVTTVTGPETGWLDPAPFRAHVIHLTASSGLTPRELAALARVSVRLIQRLVNGRDGRPMRRIDPISAGRLLALTPLEAGLVRSRLVPAERSRSVLLTLRSRGRSVASLARLTGTTATEVEGLAAGRLPRCAQLVELRLIAALAESDARMAARPAAGEIAAVRAGLADAA